MKNVNSLKDIMLVVGKSISPFPSIPMDLEQYYDIVPDGYDNSPVVIPVANFDSCSSDSLIAHAIVEAFEDCPEDSFEAEFEDHVLYNLQLARDQIQEAIVTIEKWQEEKN